MKKLFLIAAIIITGLSFQTRAQDYYDRGYDDGYNYGGYDNDGFRYFYASLSPYGTWIEFGDGVYGWRPVHMRIGWAPYANGRWIWTSDGWYWDSYEPFGYIVYHYGRWYYDNYYGWVWIPDYQWAPAWVEWRYDNDYIGWAPLPPYAIFSISIGIHFTHVYYTPYSHWHFVKYHYFCDPYVGKYYVGSKYKYRIYSRTKYRHDYGYRNGRVVNRGIDVNLIRKRGKIDIRERNIRTVSNLRDINDRNRVTNNEIRTFIPGRKNFSGATARDMKIDRTNRKTTLETSKLEFGRKNLERKPSSVQRNNEIRKTDEVNRSRNDVRIQKSTPRQNVDRSRETQQKRVIPDTRIKTNEKKNERKPVIRVPEKKVNEKTIQKKAETRNTRKAYTPQTQRRVEVKTNRSQNTSRGSRSNTAVQKQRESKSDTEQKNEPSRGRGRK